MGAPKLKVIKNDRDHARAISLVETLWNAKPGSPDHDVLEVLGVLIDEYESRRFPISAPKPIDAVLIRLEQLGLEQKALVPILGSRFRVSEVLRGKRGLSLKMIRRLHDVLGIPLESLVASKKRRGKCVPSLRAVARDTAVGQPA
ncbi:MAG: type II toxin-antitoxin system HigA family antitoxin [Myxococcaceae bacterium]